MTEELKKLAQKHVKGFLVGQGYTDPHVEYLRSALSADELQIGGKMLMSDPDAREVLIKAYRQFASGSHHFTGENDAEISVKIANQINLVRSAIIHGAYGYLDD